MRRLLSLLVLSALSFAPLLRCGVAETALDEIRRLPESNPYRAVLERYASLPEDVRTRLSDWNSADEDAAPKVLDQADQALVDELSSALVAATKEPPAPNEWKLAPSPETKDDFFSGHIPAVAPLRNLGRLAVKAAQDLPPGESLEVCAAVARFARSQRGRDTIIHQLTGVALENIAMAAATRRLNEYSPEDLRRLGDVWRALPPPPSLEAALNVERDGMFRPMLDKFLRPALLALLALQDATESPTFTRDLRLAGLVDLGGGERRISLENIANQTHFFLKEGQVIEGIELLSLDFEKRQAVIRRGHREAVINLESKEIVERRPDPEKLRQRLGGLGMFLDGGDDTSAQARWLERIRSHPRGIDGCIEDLVAEYDRKLAQQIAHASRPVEPGDSDDTPEYPFRDMTITLGKIARTFQSAHTQAVMLDAAIHHRLVQLGATDPTSAPVDPWSAEGKGFDVQPATDGPGFVLTSRYEVRPGQPVTFKFAAPDAGFVRVAKP
jgi:hypothetical protein